MAFTKCCVSKNKNFNIAKINDNRIFLNITYIDDYNSFDYDNYIVMFPAIQLYLDHSFIIFST